MPFEEKIGAIIPCHYLNKGTHASVSLTMSKILFSLMHRVHPIKTLDSSHCSKFIHMVIPNFFMPENI